MDEYSGRVDYGDADGPGFVPLRFGGHCLYVRRCITGEEDDGAEGIAELAKCRRVGALVVHGATSEQTCTAEVLGWGPRLGERVDRRYARKWRQTEIERFKACGSTQKRAEEIACGSYIRPADIRKGTLLMIPLPWNMRDERCVRIGSLHPTEAFIEESLPVYIWEEDDTLA